MSFINKLKDKVADIQQDVSQAVEKFQHRAESAGTDANAKVDGVKAGAATRADEVTDQASGAADEAKASAQKAKGDLDSKVDEVKSQI